MARIALGLLFLAACSGDDSTTDSAVETDADTDTDADADSDTDSDADTDSDTDAAPPMAQVRVLHLGPGAPPVDAFLDGDGSNAIASLAFPDPDDTHPSSTDYVTVAAGPHDVDIAMLGAGIEEAIVEADQVLLPAASHSALAAVGWRSQLDNADPPNHGPFALRVIAVPEDPTSSTGQTRLRFVHAAAGIGQIDVRQADDDSNDSNDAVIATSLAFAAPGSAIASFASEAATFYVDRSPDNGTADKDVVFALPALGATYNTVYAVNVEADDSEPSLKLVVHQVTADGASVVEPLVIDATP